MNGVPPGLADRASTFTGSTWWIDQGPVRAGACQIRNAWSTPRPRDVPNNHQRPSWKITVGSETGTPLRSVVSRCHRRGKLGGDIQPQLGGIRGFGDHPVGPIGLHEVRVRHVTAGVQDLLRRRARAVGIDGHMAHHGTTLPQVEVLEQDVQAPSRSTANGSAA